MIWFFNFWRKKPKIEEITYPLNNDHVINLLRNIEDRMARLETGLDSIISERKLVDDKLSSLKKDNVKLQEITHELYKRLYERRYKHINSGDEEGHIVHQG